MIKWQLVSMLAVNHSIYELRPYVIQLYITCVDNTPIRRRRKAMYHIIENQKIK